MTSIRAALTRVGADTSHQVSVADYVETRKHTSLRVNIEWIELAYRFRPYLKFSTDSWLGNSWRESNFPCTWQSYLRWANLVRDGRVVASSDALTKDPNILLERADIRRHAELSSGEYSLKLTDKRWRAGASWERVRDHGDGIYCQVQEIDRRLVNLAYFFFFTWDEKRPPHDLAGTGILPGDHEGDLEGISLVYDRETDRLIRVASLFHGCARQVYDLIGARTTRDGGFLVYNVAKDRAFRKHFEEKCRVLHHPGKRKIYMARSGRRGPHEHVVVWFENGQHAAWVTPGGSWGVKGSTKGHNGKDRSGLPKKITVLSRKDEPFTFYGGKFGAVGGPRLRGTWYGDAWSFGMSSRKGRVYQTLGNVPWPPRV